MRDVLLVFYTDTYHCFIFIWSNFPTINLDSYEICFKSNFGFICSCDHIKYFQIHIFYFIGKKCSTKWIFNCITTSITSVYTNDELTILKFIKIQGNKRWPDLALLIFHGYKFYSSQFWREHKNLKNKG